MRIAIVNDLALAVEALRRTLLKTPQHTVAWIAHDGAEAVRKCAADTPDLILMDLLMPVMDGAEATRRIMKQSPCAILVVTATVEGNIGLVFEAMSFGALDAVNTPVLGNPEGEAQLLDKVALIGKLLGKPVPLSTTIVPRSSTNRPPFVVALGASTGGPQALSEILAGLPRDVDAAIVIIQHVDRLFAAGLAQWLSQRAGRKVALAADGMRLDELAGRIVLAGTNDHLSLREDLSLYYTPEPLECPYRPSVDVFFKSLAAHCPGAGAAVLLTGMGRDGAQGLLALRQAGWRTLAQDEQSCVLYGMPRAAAEIHAAAQILPLGELASALAACWHTRRPG